MMDWLLEKSLLGYTRLGYQWRQRRDWEELPRLEGRVAVITGATGGLGAAAAAQLCGLGATVILVGRDASKLAVMRETLTRLPNGGPVECEIADLSNMQAVLALSERLRQRGNIDILLNNAGVLLNERRETAEGLEATFATNLLGHYILTEKLLPSLAGRADARVINVSSGGMYTQRIRVDDPETRQLAYKGPDVYARTKRGQVIMTGRWAARFPSVGVYSMHPGWADTVGVQTALPGFRKLTRPLLRNAEEGADTMTWLAAARRDRLQSGAFYHDRRIWPEHRMRATRETQADREALETLLGDYARRLLGESWKA